jgi:type IV pilus assembly protein PilO
MASLPFLDVLATAPRWQRIGFGVVILAAFGGAAYFVAVLPVQGRVDTLRALRDTQQQELARLRPQAVELARVRREAAQVERQLDIAKDKLPTEREIPALYRTLSEAAVQAGLGVALFQPQGARVRDFYSEIPIALVAEGGYHEVGDFIGRVAALPRATVVGELKLTAPKAEPARPGSPGAAGGVRSLGDANRPRASSVSDTSKPRRAVRAEMTLLTYVYRPVGSPPAPKPAGTATKAESAKP